MGNNTPSLLCIKFITRSLLNQSKTRIKIQVRACEINLNGEVDLHSIAQHTVFAIYGVY